MDILHIASEIAPAAKVGGLADVVHGLSKELLRQGHQIEVLIPKYDCIDYSQLKNLKVKERELWCQEGATRYNNTLWSATLDGLSLLLLEPHHPDYYFSRGKIYGCLDDTNRFTYFCKAAFAYLLHLPKKPELLHLHDWPAALLAPLVKSQTMKMPRTVLTIHNLEYQGKCTPATLSRLGLQGDAYLAPDALQDPAQPHLLNLLKGGIVYADALTTVSPHYEKEILTPEGGCALDKVLSKYAGKLKGILNGLDTDTWNPETDPHLIKNYCTKNVATTLLAKAENRRQLCTHLGLLEGNVPLVVCVSRLAKQKGPELICHGIERTLAKGGEFVLLASSASIEEEAPFLALQKKYKATRKAAICLDKDEALAHLIFASGDFFLIPSLFEPCGLTQLISLRYGTIPIARMTGGLIDTVFDIDTSKVAPERRNGFTFDFPDLQGVNWALDRALSCWTSNKEKINVLMQNASHHNYSWKISAQEYVKIYTRALRI